MNLQRTAVSGSEILVTPPIPESLTLLVNRKTRLDPDRLFIEAKRFSPGSEPMAEIHTKVDFSEVSADPQGWTKTDDSLVIDATKLKALVPLFRMNASESDFSKWEIRFWFDFRYQTDGLYDRVRITSPPKTIAMSLRQPLLVETPWFLSPLSRFFSIPDRLNNAFLADLWTETDRDGLTEEEGVLCWKNFFMVISKWLFIILSIVLSVFFLSIGKRLFRLPFRPELAWFNEQGRKAPLKFVLDFNRKPEGNVRLGTVLVKNRQPGPIRRLLRIHQSSRKANLYLLDFDPKNKGLKLREKFPEVIPGDPNHHSEAESKGQKGLVSNANT